jgi:hypothetical protein
MMFVPGKAFRTNLSEIGSLCKPYPIIVKKLLATALFLPETFKSPQFASTNQVSH